MHTAHHTEIIKRVEHALTVLQQGRAIVVIDDASRENEGDVIIAAQFANAENINFMIKHARGLICAPLTVEHAQQLALDPMCVDNTDNHQTAFTVSIDFKEVSTGISAAERAQTLKALSDPQHLAHTFRRPGHIFPLIAQKGGVLHRRGHTEAAVDLMKLAQLKPVAVICEILKDDGEMAREADLRDFCQTHQLPFLHINDIVQYRILMQHPIPAILSQAHLPTRYGLFEILTFPNELGGEPHVAFIKKPPLLHSSTPTPTQPYLVRIHSECLTGDVFFSQKCDCGAQLEFAMQEIAQATAGVFIYLRQEGRGIGLVEKIKAYALQDQGQDTMQANISLGHPVDRRDFSIAAAILKALHISEVNLITNNPEKKKALIEHGITVSQQIHTPRFETPENKEYLSMKFEKMGHIGA